MDKNRIEEYHQSRLYTDKAFRSSCYAPHVSMYFDTLGNVLACCQNTKYAVGNVKTERLPDIWNGTKIQKLRTALEKDRFSAGCQFCEWQISVGNYVNAFTRKFDMFPVESHQPEWPQMMEFSVSNACNLECIMCIGTLSSSIRARREGLPPIPKVYTEQFFSDLRPFLHHLKFAKFLGGEPFLEAESMKIWDIMHEEGVVFPCNVTTNGTQWTNRVVKVLERFPISICVSMDGATKKTVESIRINANFETVHENFRRFHKYTRERGTDLTLTYCLMRQNWHEFGDYLLFADDWDCPVCVNLVREPPHCSLYTLPIPELAKIAEALEKQQETILPKLGKNRSVWIDQITAIRRRVENSGESSRSPFATPLALVILDKSELDDRPDRMTADRAKAKLRELIGDDVPITTFISDEDDRVQTFLSDSGTFFGLSKSESEGQPFAELVRLLVDRIGPQRTVQIHRTTEYVDRVLLFHHNETGVLEAIRTISVPKPNEFGMPSGSVTAAAAKSIPADAPNVQADHTDKTLRDWDADGPRFEVDLDLSGNVAALNAHDHDLFGLVDKVRVGMTEAELDRACVEAWGVMQSLHDDVRIDLEMRTRAYAGERALLVVRVMTVPTFDAAGKHVGYRRSASIGVIDPARAKKIAEEAQETLSKWTSGAPVFRIFHTRTDEVLRTDGDASVLLGVEPEHLVGLPGWRIPEAFVQKHGPNRVTWWNLRAESLDMQFEHFTPTGFHAFRMISVPHFNDAGHYLGRVRYTGRWSVTRDEAAVAEEKARDLLRAWMPGGPILRLMFGKGNLVKKAECSEETFLGVPPKEFVGRWLEVFDKELEKLFGAGSIHHRDQQTAWIDALGDYDRAGNRTTVRLVTFPCVDPETNGQGRLMLIAGRTLPAGSTDAAPTAPSEPAVTKEASPPAAFVPHDSDGFGPRAQRIALVLDEQGCVQRFVGSTSSFVGIDPQAFVGLPVHEIGNVLARQLGKASAVQETNGSMSSVQVEEYRRPGALTIVRRQIVPAPDQAGAMQLNLAARVLDTETFAAEDEDARIEMRQWGDGAILRMRETADGKCLEALTDNGPWHGLEREWIEGKDSGTLAALMQQKWGELRLLADEPRLFARDAQVEFVQDGSRRLVRTLRLPDLSPSAEPGGFIRYCAARVEYDPAEPLNYSS